MKLKYKLPLLIIGALFVVSISLSLFYYFYQLNKLNGIKEKFYKEALTEKKEVLMEKVNIAILIEKQFLKKRSKMNALDIDFLQKQIFENIKILSLNTKLFHIWINELSFPYKIIMDNRKLKWEGRSILVVLPQTKENLFKLYEQKIKKYGETDLSYELYDKQTDKNILKYAYVKLLAEKDWVFGVEIDKEPILQKANLFYQDQKYKLWIEFFKFILLGFLISFSITLLMFFFVRNKVRALDAVSTNLHDFALGKNVSYIPESESKDELEIIVKASNFLIRNFNKYIRFTQEIEKGNMDDLKVSFDKNDTLGLSLNNLRLNLLEARKTEEKRQIEIQIRNWSNEGFSQFNDILRRDHDDISALAYDVISYMVQYIKAHQGAIFMYNAETKMLELNAAYAAERKKYLRKSVKIKEGLVGACAAEMDILHFKKIPEDYLIITSGLGSAPPKELLFVPLILDEILFGVIELASLHEIKSQEIEFVVRVSTSIASTLSSVRINQQTKTYLNRAKQEEELRADKEQELRLKLEELEELKKVKEREEIEAKEEKKRENGYELF